MHFFSHESVFSELLLTALGVPGAVCSIVSVLLLVEARLETSLAAVRTSNTLHSLSRSLPSNCNTFSCKINRCKPKMGGDLVGFTCRALRKSSLESEPQLELSLSSVVNFLWARGLGGGRLVHTWACMCSHTRLNRLILPAICKVKAETPSFWNLTR